MTGAAHFVGVLRRHGYRLFRDGNRLEVDAPDNRETDDVLAVLAEFKEDVVVFLAKEQAAGWRRDVLPDGTVIYSRANQPTATEPLWPEPRRRRRDLARKHRPGTCRRCGGTEFVDVELHDGRSTRRGCRRCGAFVEFSTWPETQRRNLAHFSQIA